MQRVSKAWVRVDGQEVARIAHGALVLLGVAREDGLAEAQWTARKVAKLRIFDDGEGRLNYACAQVDGAFLVVSQFTLCGDCAKGNRPSYIQAAEPEAARVLYEAFVKNLRALGYEVGEGCFRRHMQVGLVNDGPVTVLIESGSRA